MTTPVSADAASPPFGRVDVVRSEERLHLTTETVAVEKVRIEKFIVTEQRMIPVEIRREEVRMTREPVTGPGAAAGAARTGPDTIVITLHEEQVTVTKTIVPVERVTLAVITVTAQQRIDEELRSEKVDLIPDA